MNGNLFISDSLNHILLTYQSVVAFFYQTIDQTKYTNNALEIYPIDYSLLLPSSQFIPILNQNQVNAQVQAYVNLCAALTFYITNNVNTQTNLYLEGIQNTLELSISNLNGFALSLLRAQYNTLFIFTPPIDMGMTSLMYLNQIGLDTYPQQIRLNFNIPDFNNIKAGTPITLSR